MVSTSNSKKVNFLTVDTQKAAVTGLPLRMVLWLGQLF